MAKTLAQKMKTMAGYCSSCGIEIFTFVDGKPQRKDNYREHYIRLSDWTLMRVGVCDICKAKLSSGADVQKTADAIVANHKTYWKDSKGKPKEYKTLKAEDPNTDPVKFHRDKIMEEHKKRNK